MSQQVLSRQKFDHFSLKEKHSSHFSHQIINPSQPPRRFPSHRAILGLFFFSGAHRLLLLLLSFLFFLSKR
ncbi:hypothetical protein L6452_13914 [Arctium lappa]|uniref:Uncharacterized protein n=1 Tax=Arctium lappa TaxID=4217 RepID=A0ACB9CJI7_ARCLA|nr:hypothetical protein L6452_13914 [Arctium lappa]